MYKVTKHFEFEASHRLNALPEGHQCRNLHGHTYHVEVTVGSHYLDKRGFVVDFGELKTIQKRIMDDWDHAIIVSQSDPLLTKITAIGGKLFIFPYENPSAENMCHYIHGLTTETLLKSYPMQKFKVWIRVWETTNNVAEYTDVD